MSLSDDVHASVDRYRQEVVHAVVRVRELGSDVAALAQRLAPGGPLGATTDPDLTRARQQLALAAARIAAAATAVSASGEPCRQYTLRAFPRA